MSLRLAVTGAAGLFGAGLVRVLSAENNVLGLTRAAADVRDVESLRQRLKPFRPDVIIHAAAIPSPDICEQNPTLAHDVNVGGTEAVVHVSRELETIVALISSDAVFDGKKNSPYLESDPPNPIGVYGVTKLLAEERVRATENHFIFRVSVLFGLDKANFISRGLDDIRAGRDCVVALDQVGSATYVDDAAKMIFNVLHAKAYGTFHLSNSGACSRYELAREAAAVAGLDTNKVVGLPLAAMNRPGPRVPYSLMALDALERRGFPYPRHWKDALAEYLRSSPR
jgi:dTDP-4-dehydrorhamnose reductase